MNKDLVITCMAFWMHIGSLKMLCLVRYVPIPGPGIYSFTSLLKCLSKVAEFGGSFLLLLLLK